MADLIDRATPVEEVDVARLAAELGVTDDAVAVDVIRRAWRAGLFFAIADDQKRGDWSL
ncbi:MAG TPA: hypothetical protein VNS09_02375 [Solirubrobacter sp.]|nr:hypothetical protein [Solirubrobacter sp.]